MTSNDKDSKSDKTGSGDKVKEKASFYSRDTGSTSSDPETKKYVGVERRRSNRRSNTERRTEVRFEIDKEDRRKNPGRRKDDKSPKFW